MSTTPTIRLYAPDHTIKSVTIFKSSKAEIVRNFSLNTIQAGRTKVEIRGLPGSIDTHSVRVSGLGKARVACTIGVSRDYVPDSASEIIRLLQVKKRGLESERRVREHEADLFVNYAKNLTGEHVTPSQMSTFLESLVEQSRKNSNEVTELDEKIIVVDRQIKRETERKVSKKGDTRGKVSIVLGADNACTVELKLTYIVSNVSWTPMYELHANTENGKPSSSILLQYRACVIQSTGEDWANTSLTLSTMSSDIITKHLPQLMPVKLRPRGLVGNVNMPLPPPNRTMQVNRNMPVPPMMRNPALLQQRMAQMLQQHHRHQQLLQQRHSLYRQKLEAQMQALQALKKYGLTAPESGAAAAPLQGFTSMACLGLTSASPSRISTADEELRRLRSTYPPGIGASSSQGNIMSAFGASISQLITPEVEETSEEITASDALTEPATFVTETPIALSFSIAGASNVPSDGIEHQVSVAVLPFEAAITYVAIPRIEPRVYLQCQVKNSSEYRLLAGPVSVILDDSYVSNTSINDVSTGETFSCTLGDDAATKVTYSRTSRTSKSGAGAFSGAQNTTTYSTSITIHNRHSFALRDLVVWDAVPTVDDKRAKVILRKPAGLADTRDGQEVKVKTGAESVSVGWEKLVEGKGGEKEGKFAWRANVKAKAWRIEKHFLVSFRVFFFTCKLWMIACTAHNPGWVCCIL
ncbi:hypothetical protein DXG01_009105 [Tephrocybe rancida]|nr:hypothetical protein DXG01_009105 [Tephrocybe rancida]